MALCSATENLHTETAPKSPHLPNPWTGPTPKSAEQPQLVVKLCFFNDQLLQCHKGKEFPYDLSKDGDHRQVPFFELLGYGQPPSDIAGNPGDVYIDLTPPCRVYVWTTDTWVWWNWSVKDKRRQWLAPIPQHFPRHPILSNRYLSQHHGTLRLSWLTKATIKRVFFNEQSIVETYGTLCTPSGENQERMEIETKRRLVDTQCMPSQPGGKRGRSPSPADDQSESSSDTPGEDKRIAKKAKLTSDKDEDETTEGIGSGKVRCTSDNSDGEIQYQSKPSRHSPISSHVSSSSEGIEGIDEEGEVDQLDEGGLHRNMDGRGGDDSEGMAVEGPTLEPILDHDIHAGDGEDNASSVSKVSVDFIATDTENENSRAGDTMDTPDALTTRTLTLWASVKELNNARLAAEKRAKMMKAQQDDFAEKAKVNEARILTLETQVNSLTTANQKFESEKKDQGEADEKIRALLKEIEEYKSDHTHLVSKNTTYKKLYGQTATKWRKNEQKILELSKQCADADAARVASEKALTGLKEMLRKIAV